MEKHEIRNARQNYLAKSNEIIRLARIKLTAGEMNLTGYLISKIQADDTALKWYTISVKDYCEICGIDYRSGKNYNQIKRVLKSLSDKSFWMINDRGEETLFRWIEKPTINRGRGTISVKLDEDLQKYVIGLRKSGNYTQYQFLSTLPMRSAYSKRVYEILKSYEFTGRPVVLETDYLRRVLCAEKYQSFTDFRRFILDKAKEEINAYTDIEIDWKAEKDGRKYSRVIFTITPRDTWGRYEAMERANSALDADQIPGQTDIFDFIDQTPDVVAEIEQEEREQERKPKRRGRPRKVRRIPSDNPDGRKPV